ncbi:MAG: hypothetical protein H0V93_04035 [Euzebyales bacterium]|jgi:hypothetical protein|nr:hypothetical protein [Euzebyales bacterium]
MARQYRLFLAYPRPLIGTSDTTTPHAVGDAIDDLEQGARAAAACS